jgi:hypothetical protein
LKEINAANHYIGMRELKEDDFTEFKWIPFVIGGVMLLAARRRARQNVEARRRVCAVHLFRLVFAMEFYHKLYLYGHELDPTAAGKVAPFTPPIIGHHTLANFRVYSYPAIGSYFMAAMPLFLLAAMWLSKRAWMKGRAAFDLNDMKIRR